ARHRAGSCGLAARARGGWCLVSRPLRVVVVLAGGLLAFVALANFVERLTPTPGGPRSSSYATAPDGLAAYAELLGDYGHSVRRIRSPASETTLDPSSTIVVLDPGSI